MHNFERYLSHHLLFIVFQGHIQQRNLKCNDVHWDKMNHKLIASLRFVVSIFCFKFLRQSILFQQGFSIRFALGIQYPLQYFESFMTNLIFITKSCKNINSRYNSRNLFVKFQKIDKKNLSYHL